MGGLSSAVSRGALNATVCDVDGVAGTEEAKGICRAVFGAVGDRNVSACWNMEDYISSRFCIENFYTYMAMATGNESLCGSLEVNPKSRCLAFSGHEPLPVEQQDYDGCYDRYYMNLRARTGDASYCLNVTEVSRYDCLNGIF